MVLYFTSTVVDPPAKLYMGFDKHENEELIRWGWPEDVWFHVDKLSSAHVYLRLEKGQTLDDIPQELLDDCAQLTKANSIQGTKMNNIKIVYTMWSNLKKTGNMAVGQVGFNSDKEVRLVSVERKVNEIVNRLNKTKVVVEHPDLRMEREARDEEERKALREVERKRKQQEREETKRKEEEKQLRSYDSLFSNAEYRTNKDDDDGNDSDDFM